MKTLLIFPPQWMPVSPHFALPTLLGQFEGTGYEASVMDLNIDFYNKILTSDYVKRSLNLGTKLLPVLRENIQKYFVKGKKLQDYTFAQQNEIAKASMIDNLLKKHGENLKTVATIIDKSVDLQKSFIHFKTGQR